MKKCQVVIADDKVCDNDAVAVFKCVVELENGKMLDQEIHTCDHHKRHFDDNNI
jgi:hypothetical protein